MAVSREKIKEALGKMPVLELVDLIKELEDEWGVSAAAPVAAAAGPSGAGSVEINSQTPGNVWKILKSAGDSVNEGEQIMILEAMKMEIDIVAEKAGVIKSIDVNTNDAVIDGQLLATME